MTRVMRRSDYGMSRVLFQFNPRSEQPRPARGTVGESLGRNGLVTARRASQGLRAARSIATIGHASAAQVPANRRCMRDAPDRDNMPRRHRAAAGTEALRTLY